MKLKKFLIVALFSTVLLGGIASAAYLHSVVELYKDAAPCGELKGVPALLQKAHLISVVASGCAVSPVTGCNVGADCSIANPTSGAATPGHCARIQSQSNPCACVASPNQQPAISSTSPE